MKIVHPLVTKTFCFGYFCCCAVDFLGRTNAGSSIGCELSSTGFASWALESLAGQLYSSLTEYVRAASHGDPVAKLVCNLPTTSSI
jgi:hypothetical protein